MRPAGDVRVALLAACRALATPQQGATVRELAQRACVGVEAARRTVENMSRAKQLYRVRERRVAYRNRPVAEYVPADWIEHDAGHVDLARVLQVWVG